MEGRDSVVLFQVPGKTQENTTDYTFVELEKIGFI